MSDLKYKNIIWIIYFIAVGLSVLGSLSNLFSIGCFGAGNCLARWENWKYVFAILIIALHGSYTIGWKKIIWFVLLSSGIGFISEYSGLHYGQLAGVGYIYRSGNATFFDVPILILIFWSFFVYTGYSIINSFLAWKNKERPKTRNKDFNRVWRLAASDGLLVLLIDLFMEPIMVARGEWQWLNSGVYFSIPAGNFIGWFLVAFISMFIFRTLEYKFAETNKNFDLNFLLMPVAGYALIALDFAVAAILLDLPKLILIGFPLMTAVVVYNFFQYFKYKLTLCKK